MRWLLFLFPVWFALSLSAEEKPVVPGEQSVIRFSVSPGQSSDPELVKHRVMASENPGDYDVSNEAFEILLPETKNAREPYGLFIWVSAGNSPKIPKEWEKVLARNRLIFIGAQNSGNRRNIFDRIRMAIDANHNMRQRYQIDGRRVYVSGFSGGSRVASMLGVAWGDMFSGTICCMGANFYSDITAPDSKVYGLNYIPNEQLLPLVKKACRYSLITAEKDFNLANTRGVYKNGFVKEGFQHVQIFEVPGIAHKMPPADWLGKAIQFVDQGKE